MIQNNKKIDLVKLKKYLDKQVKIYNTPDFIKNDPISIPHQFKKKQDIEISAFITALIAWGKRSMIINNAKKIIAFMKNSPHDFLLNNKINLSDLESLGHRTFLKIDLFYILTFLKYHYSKNESLESAFEIGNFSNMDDRLNNFHDYIFSLKGFEERTRKHIPHPKRRSACKKINLFLRWMVRYDNNGVDFGLWKKIAIKDLIFPLDIHVCRISNLLGILNIKQVNWKAAIELTNIFKILDENDPIKYDFALFGMGESGFFSNNKKFNFPDIYLN